MLDRYVDQVRLIVEPCRQQDTLRIPPPSLADKTLAQSLFGTRD